MKDFSLTLGDLHYSLPDVGFYTHPDFNFVGGLAYGVEGGIDLTNDFGLVLRHDQTGWLGYTAEGWAGHFTSGAFSQNYTELAVTAVPEPEVYGMMLAGLGLLGTAARRRKA